MRGRLASRRPTDVWKVSKRPRTRLEHPILLSAVVACSFRNANHLTVIGRSINLRPVPEAAFEVSNIEGRKVAFLRTAPPSGYVEFYDYG
jgi:hypothetical protein